MTYDSLCELIDDSLTIDASEVSRDPFYHAGWHGVVVLCPILGTSQQRTHSAIA